MFRRICHRFLCGSSIYYNTPDSLGYTKLHRAASNGQYKEVRRLVERGADVNIKTKNYGVTAVMEAAMREHGDIVQYLHQAGTNINISDKYRWTAVMLAAYKGHGDIVKFLQEAGADINIRDQCGVTAVMLAAVMGHEDIHCKFDQI